MPKTFVTRNVLYQLDQEITSIKNESPALALLLSGPIEKFYKNASMELQVTKARFKAILKNFVQHDADGKALTQGEEGKKEWLFNESHVAAGDASLTFGAENVKELFNEAANNLMQQKISFDW